MVAVANAVVKHAVKETTSNHQNQEEESVLSLIRAVLDIKGVSSLNINLRALVHLLKKVMKPETWQALLQVKTRRVLVVCWCLVSHGVCCVVRVLWA